MGILNVTPDSFSDGGLYLNVDDAVQSAYNMIDAGADIIDIGGESTRPGASKVSVEEEIRRVAPVIKALKQNQDVYLSLDTSKAEVMQVGIDLGINMINDVRALQNNNSLKTFLNSQCDICLMHMQGSPETMQDNPYYEDVVEEVLEFLNHRKQLLINNKVTPDRIVIDPGFGFGKSHADNLLLFQNIKRISKIHPNLLIGISRKSLIKNIFGPNENDIIQASAILAAVAAKNGASILRVHDVNETKKAVEFLS